MLAAPAAEGAQGGPEGDAAVGEDVLVAGRGSLDAGSWVRLLPGLVIAGVGSGLLNAALPLLAVESVPASRAAMGAGAQQTFRYIGSCAGVALTIAIATSSGGGLAHGADIAMLVSAGLALVAAASVAGLRER